MVSIIIVNYNTYNYTKKCVASIYDKVKNTNFEIIIVSNGSDDYPISNLCIEFDKIKLIENTDNFGFAKANNIGISISIGDYILLLNSDTELINDAVAIAKEVLIKNSDIGIVSSQLLYPDGELQPTCQNFPSITSEILETTRLFKLFNKELIAKNYINSWLNLKTDHYCDWVWGTFFMFRKQDLLKLPTNKLSELFFMYGEDMEWCYQFKLINLKCYYVSAAKVYHFVGKSNFGNSFKKNSTIIKNEIIFIKKYKGYFYSLVIRVLKSIKYLIQSLKNKSCFELAKLYALPYE